MSYEKTLRDKRVEIHSIFSKYGARHTRILDSIEPPDSGEDPDIEILLSLEEKSTAPVIICLHRLLPGMTSDYAENVCNEFHEKLGAMLGCVVDVVDKRGLESFYPATYRKKQQ